MVSHMISSVERVKISTVPLSRLVQTDMVNSKMMIGMNRFMLLQVLDSNES